MNTLYDKGKEHLLKGDINMIADTIKVILVDSQEYTFNSTHETIANVPAGGIVATATLANKSVTNGVFDADDATFTSVTGDQSEYLIIYKDTGTAATSYLIAFYDTATLLPITPNGSNIVAQWSNGVSKVFAL